MPLGNRSDPGYGSGPPRYPGTFLLALREAVQGVGWRISRWLGGAVACQDADGQEHVVGLENLYRRARREDRSRWPELIAGFLSSVDLKQFQEPPEDLVAVADRLLVRVGQPLAVRADSMEVWSQPVAGTGLVLNLVVDYPQSMFYVTQHMVTNSAQPGEAWLERAVANLHRRTPAECFEVVHAESGIRQCTVGDAYDSSRVLLLDCLLPEGSADGYFVTLPGRDELMVLPVTAAALTYIPLMKAVAQNNFKKAPYPISEEVFWLRQGHWLPFPVELRNERVTVEPPAEFLQVLRRLVPEEQLTSEEEPPAEPESL